MSRAGRRLTVLAAIACGFALWLASETFGASFHLTDREFWQLSADASEPDG
jgi:hypothetical protein